MSKKKKNKCPPPANDSAEEAPDCERDSPYKQRVIAQLLRGQPFYNYREGGGSMEPRIPRGWLKTLEPIKDPSLLKKKDIVLCRVRHSIVTHKIHQIRMRDGVLEFLIGNNLKGKRKKLNGWTSEVYGICTAVYKDKLPNKPQS